MSYWNHTASRTTVAPTAEMATATEIARYCRADSPEQIAIIESLFEAAERAAEKETGLSFLTQTRQVFFPKFFNPMRIPYGPVQSIESIKYYDGQNELQTLGEDWYQAISAFPPYVRRAENYTFPKTKNRDDAVIIEYIAGFEEVPATLKIGVMALTMAMFDNPASNGETLLRENSAISRLLSIETVMGV